MCDVVGMCKLSFQFRGTAVRQYRRQVIDGPLNHRPACRYKRQCSANTSRTKKPSASRLRNVEVSIFDDTSGSAFRNSPKRIGPVCRCNAFSTSNDHLSPTRASTLRTGQFGKNISLTSIIQSILYKDSARGVQWQARLNFFAKPTHSFTKNGNSSYMAPLFPL